MKPDVVVDVGNSRIKWGRCNPTGIEDAVSLPNDSNAWEHQVNLWKDKLPPFANWVVAGVVPDLIEKLISWLNSHAFAVELINSHKQLKLSVSVDQPEQVGIDRLLNAIAALRRFRSGTALIVDAGSAVTIDLIQARHRFLGGAIVPGVKLMGKSLSEHTSRLPVVSIDKGEFEFPAKSTENAIKAGIMAAVCGSIDRLLNKVLDVKSWPKLFLTGGDAGLLEPYLNKGMIRWEVWPTMTLEGIRIAAEALP